MNRQYISVALTIVVLISSATATQAIRLGFVDFVASHKLVSTDKVAIFKVDNFNGLPTNEASLFPSQDIRIMITETSIEILYLCPYKKTQASPKPEAICLVYQTNIKDFLITTISTSQGATKEVRQQWHKWLIDTPDWPIKIEGNEAVCKATPGKCPFVVLSKIT